MIEIREIVNNSDYDFNVDGINDGIIFVYIETNKHCAFCGKIMLEFGHDYTDDMPYHYVNIPLTLLMK